jgi:Leucine-rich repeat (LRR) protein
MFLSGCYSLRVLKLSNNQLQGKIFSKHANLTGLVGLFLDGNNFTGSLEEGLLKSKNLTLLDISDNRFSGMLPLWIGRISRLSYLYMSGNQLKVLSLFYDRVLGLRLWTSHTIASLVRYQGM